MELIKCLHSSNHKIILKRELLCNSNNSNNCKIILKREFLCNSNNSSNQFQKREANKLVRNKLMKMKISIINDKKKYILLFIYFFKIFLFMDFN